MKSILSWEECAGRHSEGWTIVLMERASRFNLGVGVREEGPGAIFIGNTTT